MSPTFQAALLFTLCMLALVMMIGYVGWCCHLLHAHANGDIRGRQLSVPIVVYSHHPEAGVSQETGNPTLATAMDRPPAEVPETPNNTDTTRTYVV